MNKLNLNDKVSECSEKEIIDISFHQDLEKLLISHAIIDGMNIAMLRKKNKKGKLNDILKVYNMLKDSYDTVEIYVDASIRYRIDNKGNLEKLIKDGIIFICPAGIMADELIWKRSTSLTSEGHDIAIITNDMFPVTKYSPTFHKLKNITVSILNTGEVYMIERDLNRLYHRLHDR
jgi:hypothetical protein